MTSELINLSTGPLNITNEVKHALGQSPISHRSSSFKKLYSDTTAFLNTSFSVNETYLLTGSGTLANEAMLWQIKMHGGMGLILINGEFGSRLEEQAKRTGLDFTTCQIEWGSEFDLLVIEKQIQETQPGWVLFCHCETSTGVVNPLDELTALGKKYRFRCYADCMSTVGTRPLDLSGLTMATASSGKGLASVPGIAIIFANVEVLAGERMPIYLDLHHYKNNEGIPFTLSSNLLLALYTSIKQKLCPEQYNLSGRYWKAYSHILESYELMPFNNRKSRVCTVVPPDGTYKQFIASLTHQGIKCSYESNYLSERGWIQIALFGYYTEEALASALVALKTTCESIHPVPSV
ncbi:MAG TPA: aminotransferase class V-fold PLP-dependent enzyme, partial [Chitinophagaceae bacterium]